MSVPEDGRKSILRISFVPSVCFEHIEVSTPMIDIWILLETDTKDPNNYLFPPFNSLCSAH